MLEGPTGFGKSAVGKAMLNICGKGFITSPLNTLVRQYSQDEHLGLTEVRGQSTYTCRAFNGLDCETASDSFDDHNTKCMDYVPARLIPPEDLQAGRATNPRLSDIFQTGLLLYRLLENGSWPFDDTFQYVTSGGVLRPFSEPATDQETETLRTTAVHMLDLQPGNRPDLLSKVEQELHRFLS